MTHICLIYPQRSSYGVLHAFSKAMERAFQELGCQVTAYDDSPGRSVADKIRDIQKIQADASFYFNSLVPITGNGYLSDHSGCRHIAYLVDSPHQFIPFEPSERNLMITVDGGDCDYYRERCGQSAVMHLPHGVDPDGKAAPDCPRRYPVSFLGSCIDHQVLRAKWQKELLPSQNRQLDALIEIVMDDRSIYYWDAICELCDPRNLEQCRLMWHYLDLYVRGADRLEMFRVIQDFEVHVFGASAGGRDWDQFLGDNGIEVNCHAALPYPDAIKIMQESQVVLNSCPTYKRGTHERALAAMAAGALVMTDDNAFMWDHFAPGEECWLYQPQYWDSFAEELGSCLEDEVKRLDIASRGQKKVLEEHTWSLRAEAILEAIK